MHGYIPLGFIHQGSFVGKSLWFSLLQGLLGPLLPADVLAKNYSRKFIKKKALKSMII